ncbi:MAG: MBOAT family O-acyltransferase [Salibacteraceae bacterium]
MFFNSIDFAVFLPLVFAAYWLIPRQRVAWQNAWLLLASMVFYGWWDWRFLGLILLSTGIDFVIGQQLSVAKAPGKRKALLSLSLISYLGILGFFKYCNFFIDNFVSAFSLLGQELHVTGLAIVLPVGISFYTFQTLSYTIDVSRGKLAPTRDPLAFAAFVSFFPQLVAGPIERATHLLPQFFAQRKFEMQAAIMGLRQILWGLFKKMVIADNCATFVDPIFENPGGHPGSSLAIGAVLFAFQIYGDFSGYSDIAIGTARLFGFRLKQNFAYPYFSRDIAEFWRRWHISLSTWFRDYLYIPLGGSRGGRGQQIRNVFLIFLVSGFWHGANWTFLIWGALHACFFLPQLLLGSNRKHLGVVAIDRCWPSVIEALQMLGTFLLTSLAWIFFRARSLSEASAYFQDLFSVSLFASPSLRGKHTDLPFLGAFILLMLLMEWLGRSDRFALEQLNNWSQPVWRWSFYVLLALLIFIFGENAQQFIYFQF